MRHMLNYELFKDKSPLLALQNNVDNHLINVITNLIPTNSSILEISCGNGADSLELINKGYNVIATDYNKNHIDYLKDVIDVYYHDSREKFPFKDNQFDLVYSRLGLHYFTVDELKLIFDEISRMTKKYLVYTVKLENDVNTGKVILTQDTWEELTKMDFDIISSKVKKGLLYNNPSTWLEVIAIKK